MGEGVSDLTDKSSAASGHLFLVGFLIEPPFWHQCALLMSLLGFLLIKKRDEPTLAASFASSEVGAHRPGLLASLRRGSVRRPAISLFLQSGCPCPARFLLPPFASLAGWGLRSLSGFLCLSPACSHTQYKHCLPTPPLPSIRLMSQLLVESELSAYIFMTINYFSELAHTVHREGISFLHRFLVCLVFYLTILSLSRNTVKSRWIWSHRSAGLLFPLCSPRDAPQGAGSRSELVGLGPRAHLPLTPPRLLPSPVPLLSRSFLGCHMSPHFLLYFLFVGAQPPGVSWECTYEK